MPIAREWTPEERRIVISGRAEGLSAMAISRRLDGRNKQAVLRFCRREAIAKAESPSRRRKRRPQWPADTRFEDCPIARRDTGSRGPISTIKRWI